MIEKKQSIAVNKATSDFVKEELFGNIKTKDITKQYLNFKIKGKVQFDNKKIPMLVKSSQIEKPKLTAIDKRKMALLMELTNSSKCIFSTIYKEVISNTTKVIRRNNTR